MDEKGETQMFGYWQDGAYAGIDKPKYDTKDDDKDNEEEDIIGKVRSYLQANDEEDMI